MRVLVLGGTVFLGRHVASEALARGHEVTVLTRGLHGVAPDGVEHVVGDRADPRALRGRSWDAAIDTCGYDPAHVAASVALDVGHYVFVSSVNAYEDWPERPVDESSPTWREGSGYGPDKAACERLVLPHGAVVRPGVIVGPDDEVLRLPWWVRRIGRGGVVPAPGDPSLGVQVVDVRDLAAFLVGLAERRVAGVFNARAALTMGELLRACGDAELVWISDDALEAAGVEPWTELPLWLPARYAGTWSVGTDRAVAEGLRCRPITETIADVAAWLTAGGAERVSDLRAEGRPPEMSASREAELLALVG